MLCCFCASPIRHKTCNDNQRVFPFAHTHQLVCLLRERFLTPRAPAEYFVTSFQHNLLFASNTYTHMHARRVEAYEKWSSSLLSIIFYLPLMRLSSCLYTTVAYACTYYTGTAPLHMYILYHQAWESKICPSFSLVGARVSQIGGISLKVTHTRNIVFFYMPMRALEPVLERAILR